MPCSCFLMGNHPVAIFLICPCGQADTWPHKSPQNKLSLHPVSKLITAWGLSNGLLSMTIKAYVELCMSYPLQAWNFMLWVDSVYDKDSLTQPILACNTMGEMITSLHLVATTEVDGRGWLLVST